MASAGSGVSGLIPCLIREIAPSQRYGPYMPVLPELEPILAVVNNPDRPATGTVPVADVRAGYETFAKLAGPAPALHSIEDRSIPGPLPSSTGRSTSGSTPIPPFTTRPLPSSTGRSTSGSTPIPPFTTRPLPSSTGRSTSGSTPIPPFTTRPLPIRIYRPSAGTLPALVWVHGGGWTIGSIESDNTRCAVMAQRAGVVVISVEYRLAPEHPFPAAIDDTVAAVRWVSQNAAELGIDPGAIALGGDSAGGNLTAVAAQVLRDEGNSPLRFQLLVYPATDVRGDYPSIRDNAQGYYLTKAGMDWFDLMYSPGVDPSDARRSPLLGKLHGLPPALLLTCEFDPLRDEGAAYAQALQDAGVPCTHINYPGMIHTCFGMEALWPSTKAMMDDAVAALRSGLGLASVAK